jgi:hypothetical protein
LIHDGQMWTVIQVAHGVMECFKTDRSIGCAYVARKLHTSIGKIRSRNSSDVHEFTKVAKSGAKG